MKPDGTDSLSTAHVKLASNQGNLVSEPDPATGSEVEKYPHPNAATWSYLFVHHSRVKTMEEQLAKDGRTYFVHKTVRYFKKSGKHTVQRREIPTVSGLVFLQGSPVEIQSYLSNRFPLLHLCKSCTTGRVAVIPDSQMRPFMRLNQTEPERIRFLLKPFHYYARNRILLRITSGELAGLEGYIIRIDRDRRLVMNVGGISVAISGVHAEHFEEVRSESSSQSAASPFYERNLHEREALIDRYFHPVKTPRDVALQAENIDYLRNYVSAELSQRRMDIHTAWTTSLFIIKEIAYYYTPLIDQFGAHLAPILAAGSQVFQQLDTLLANPSLSQSAKERYEADRQELLTKYGYMF